MRVHKVLFKEKFYIDNLELPKVCFHLLSLMLTLSGQHKKGGGEEEGILVAHLRFVSASFL